MQLLFYYCFEVGSVVPQSFTEPVGIAFHINQIREWTYGLSGKRVQRALQKWKVIPMKADSYWFADVDDADLKAILDSYSLNISPKLYTDGELRKLKKEIQTF